MFFSNWPNTLDLADMVCLEQEEMKNGYAWGASEAVL